MLIVAETRSLPPVQDPCVRRVGASASRRSQARRRTGKGVAAFGRHVRLALARAPLTLTSSALEGLHDNEDELVRRHLRRDCAYHR